jgi:hypothetical protein
MLLFGVRFMLVGRPKRKQIKLATSKYRLTSDCLNLLRDTILTCYREPLIGEGRGAGRLKPDDPTFCKVVLACRKL